MRIVVLRFLSLWLLPASVYGQQPPPQKESANFRADAALAVIPVTVTNSLGEPIGGLSRERFQLLVDGSEQPIASFASEDLPVSVCLVIDLSQSMRRKMRVTNEAVIHLLKSFDQTGDEFCLILFNEEPKLLVPFTSSPSAIEHALRRGKPLGRTALFDAIQLARVQMRSARNTRKVIVVISDGGDNHSRLTATDVHRQIQESDAQVYAMSVEHTDLKGLSAIAIEELNGPILLNEIARQTGGRHVELSKLKDLPAACAEIANKLHNQYLIGYAPAARDGKSHRLEIRATGDAGVRYGVLHRTELFIPAK